MPSRLLTPDARGRATQDQRAPRRTGHGCHAGHYLHRSIAQEVGGTGDLPRQEPSYRHGKAMAHDSERERA